MAARLEPVPAPALEDAIGPLCASIVIPTFNRRQLLLQTLDSLTRQSVGPDRYEVIVAMDGSNDGTLEALQAFHPPYRLRWIWQPNRGPAAARNAAAELAEEIVLIFLDDDQRAAPGLVAAHLSRHATAGTVLVQGYYPMAEGCARRGTALVFDRSLGALPSVVDSGGRRRWHVWGANFSVRAETWRAVGGFDDAFRGYGGEDTDFGLRVSELGVPCVFEPRALSHHLHDVAYAAFRRRSFSEGLALVAVARKHGLPLHAFSGGALDRRADRILRLGWRRAPAVPDLAGRVLLAGLRLADLGRFAPAQLALARAVRWLYKVGGVERAEPWRGCS
jgi:glycosyltransferase involved in cell wall biosynthesis